MIKKDVVDFITKVEEISKIGLKYTTDLYAKDNYLELQQLANDFLKDTEHIELNRPNFFERDIYPTPNVSVRIVILNETRDKVLLVQERSDGGYCLPGGWSELLLSPSESAMKEVREEVGAECKIVKLIGVLDKYQNKHTTGIPEYILGFEAQIVGEIGESCHEIISKDFFDINNLPKLSIKMEKPELLRLINACLNNDTIFD